MEKETRILHPQIIFQPFCTTEEINIPQFYTCNANLNLHIHHSLPVHIQQVKIFNLPQLHKDRRLQEFLQGEICCQNFINQDLTFLQLCQIYPDRQLHPAPDNIENPPPSPSITTQDNTVQHNPDTDHKAVQPISDDYLPQPPPLDFIYEWERSVKAKTAVLPVEPVLGLTPEQQEKWNEDPKVTLEKLLELSSCQGYIQTLLQTLDGLYVNQSN